MNKIFIDLGAYNGDSVEYFLEKYCDSVDYKIYTFEPNPKHAFILKRDQDPGYLVIEKAAWIYDGEIDFYLAKDHGSSLFKNKTTGDIDRANPIKVGCVDFSQWIKKNISKDDYVILKMDIEGAEFEVLEKMLADGTMEWLNQLWVEFHPNKIRGVTTTQSNLLKDKLSKLNLIFKEWH